MDHLAPLGTLVPRYKFPLYGDPGYDHGTFADYPDRNGFDSRLIQTSHYHEAFAGKSAFEVAVFVQNWLYFGFLESVTGRRVNVEDFIILIDGQRYLTTAKLPLFISEWIVTLPSDFTDSVTRPKLRETSMFIETVRQHCRTLCNGVVGLYYPVSDKTPKPLLLSIAILGTTLGYAFRHFTLASEYESQHESEIFLLHNAGDWGTPHYEDIFLGSGWCPNDVVKLERNLFVTGIVYATTIKRAELVSHQNCTEYRCSANDIVPGTPYICKHTQENCKCSHIGPSISDVVAVLERDEIPILELSFVKGVSEFRVIPYAPGLQYIAISHVWSDGDGNPFANTIPRCKARRFFYILQHIHECDYGIRATRLNFWIDTLCVPVSSTEHRSIAIKFMAETYLYASGVLVLDSEMQQHYHMRCSPQETLMRILCSAWMRRVWTLQEAVMASSIDFLCADGLFNVNWNVRELLQRVAMPMALDPLTHEVCRFFVVLDVLHYAHPGVRFEGTWTAMQYRQTSVADDECTCFANILGVDPTPLLSLGRSDDKSRQISEMRRSERMKVLFSMLDTVPKGILWSNGPKLLLDGYRWAPSSFHGGDVGHLLTGHTKRDEFGLHVQSPGLLLYGEWRDPNTRSDCIYRLNDNRRIQVSKAGSWHLMHSLDRNGVSFETSPQWDCDTQLGLIQESHNGTYVVLVSIQQQADELIRCRFERTVRIRYVDMQPQQSVGVSVDSQDSFGEATWTPDDQWWHVA